MEVRRPFVYSVGFALLLLAYAGVGIYLIQVNGLTADETAYIGAAYAYSQGVGLNPEHPLLLKILNSFLFSCLFPQIQVSLPDLNRLDPVQIRLAAFDAGYQVLMYYPDAFEAVIQGSRLLYLAINGLFLVWLYGYSVVLRLLDPAIALIMGGLWLFSPSLMSHSALVTFDVTVSWSALTTILSATILIYSYLQKKHKLVFIQFTILTLSLGLALNTKFSNLLLLPILFIGLGSTALYLWHYICRRSALQLIVGSSLCLLIQPLLTLAMYRFAFRAMGENHLIDLGRYYWQGLQMTLVTAKGEQVPFLWGQFRPVTYGQYLTKILVFKENPGLGLLLAMIIWVLLLQLKTIFSQTPNPFLLWIKQGLKFGHLNHSRLYLISIAIFIALYPLAYTYLAQGSRFVIGYRYFYPVIFFLYFLIAVVLVRWRPLYPSLFFYGALTLYVVFGLLGLPQGLSYVSPLWPMPKWLLANDSTLNWGQENQQVVNYLYHNSLLPKRNQKALIYSTFNAAININQYVEILNKNNSLGLDLQSYYDQPRFNPLEQKIENLEYDYLLVDSTVLQALESAKANPPVGIEMATITGNLKFLEEHRPIYTHNDIMFLYTLR
ncbi:hypothetical protein [Synechocystis sp. LKSZ1]|uniref:hypothetical protein n=1 Tax=Synechocystis sp. LKSZ1 TaxID=3144951 RepID=UPI00336C0498